MFMTLDTWRFILHLSLATNRQNLHSNFLTKFPSIPTEKSQDITTWVVEVPTIGPVPFIVKVDNILQLKAAFVHASHQHKKQPGEVAL